MGAEERQPLPDLKETLGEIEKGAAATRSFGSSTSSSAFRQVAAGGAARPGVGRAHPPAPGSGADLPSTRRGRWSHVKYPDGIERTRVTTTFMGLYGSTSPLPTHFAEQIALTTTRAVRSRSGSSSTSFTTGCCRSSTARGRSTASRRRTAGRATIPSRGGCSARRASTASATDPTISIVPLPALRAAARLEVALGARPRGGAHAISSARWASASSSSSGTGR
jgi:hypothetical protein